MTTTAADAALAGAADRRDRPLSEAHILFLVVLALTTVGVLMVYSASQTVDPEGANPHALRQACFAVVGLAAFVFGAMFPYRWLSRAPVAVLTLAGSVALLVLVLAVGVGRGGVRRFLALPGGLNFQPSELAKFAVVIFLAWWFSRPTAPGGSHRARARSFLRGFLPAVGVIGLVCGFVVKADFGTAALIATVAVLVCLIAGWRWWYPALLAAPAAAACYATVVRVPYRWERILVWLDPWKYYNDAGWHICQSLMAIGSGGLLGLGPGAGIQKHYIPESTTDFIFAVLCEEMGILGGILVIGLFGVLVWRGGRIVRHAPDRFGFLLASGILLVIALQAMMNIGVVTSALPAKGISLPLVSYGGSGLATMGFAAGLLASVGRAAERGTPLVHVSKSRRT
ncbi:MAG: FtsW/RodA/SpoVE family cell cycle protein [Phycisphaerae bacterium]